MTRRLIIAVLILLALGTLLPAQRQKTPRKSSGVRWANTFEDTALAAVKHDAPIIIYAYRDNHSGCRRFERTVIDSKNFRRLSRMFVMIRAEATRDKDRLRPYQVTRFPTLIFLDSSGRQLYRQDKDLALKRTTGLMGQTWLMSMYNSGKHAKDIGDIRRARRKFIPLVFIGRGTPVAKLAEKELRRIEADSIMHLSRAKIALDEKQYVKTMTILDDLIYHYRGTSGGKEGLVLIKRLVREVETLEALKESRRRADADRKLAYAKKIESRAESAGTLQYGKHCQKEALMVYWDVVRDYPGTPASEEAAKHADRLAADKPIAEQAKKERVERDYKRWSEIAQSYARNGKTAEAVESCERIIKHYPDTPQARKAREAINLLLAPKPTETRN